MTTPSLYSSSPLRNASTGPACGPRFAGQAQVDPDPDPVLATLQAAAAVVRTLSHETRPPPPEAVQAAAAVQALQDLAAEQGVDLVPWLQARARARSRTGQHTRTGP